MTPAEFDKWFDHYCAAFPSLFEWFRRLTDREATRGHWQRALANTSLADAIAVTDQMAIGEIDAPLEWEQRDQTAIVVRREAAKSRSARRTRKTAEAARPMPSRHGGMLTPLRTLLSRAQSLGGRLRAGQISKDDHDLEMEQVLHEAKKGAGESRRYRCMACNDNGLIVCWNTIAVSQFRIKGELERSRWSTMVLACGGCESGRVYWVPEAEGGRMNPMPRYQLQQHCRLISGCGTATQADFEELKRWLSDDYLPPAMAGDFAEWNQGAEV